LRQERSVPSADVSSRHGLILLTANWRLAWSSFRPLRSFELSSVPLTSVFTPKAPIYNTGVKLRSFVALIALFVSPTVPQLAIAQTQAAMTEAACNKLKNAETALNRVYEQVLKTKAADAGFLKAFQQAQEAWVAFRDAHVHAIYPDPDPRAYGSANSMCRCTILEEMTTQRSRQLRRLWIEGIDEGDVCTGSCAVRPAGAVPNRKK
jgi:uncharacterized protein YecT (DUF1311 family)